MRRRTLVANNWLFEPSRRLLTPRANVNAPIRDAFDCSSRKPMKRHIVSGFPRALLSLSQEKSSGVEIEGPLLLRLEQRNEIATNYH